MPDRPGPHPEAPDPLRQLAADLQDFANARGWARYHSPKNLAAALAVEAAELLEHFQWLTEAQSDALAPAAKVEVADEMADVLLYLLQLGNRLDIDLMQAARSKLARNATRFPAGAAPDAHPQDPASPG